MTLREWRRGQTEQDPGGGVRQLTQGGLARAIGISAQYLCRVETGNIWPGQQTICLIKEHLLAQGMSVATWKALHTAQEALWRAYSPDRKGMTP